MKAAIDASSLIFLAKIGELGLVLENYQLYTCKDVLDEVLGEEYEEIAEIKKFIDKGKILEIKGERIKPNKATGVHLGEYSLIINSKKNGIGHIIIDDYIGIKTAKYLGLKPFSLPFVFLSFLKTKKINFERFEKIMEKLTNEGYYLSIALYNKIMERARECK